MIMNRFVKLKIWFQAPVRQVHNETCSWIGEPMDHPAITSMTQHQLADLPIPAFATNSRGKLVQVFECAGPAELILK
jgi:hypothetical protein